MKVSLTNRIELTLFTVFLVLKLTGLIDWSWWWVTAPLWAPIVAAAVVFLGVFVVAYIVAIVAINADSK